MSDAVFSTKDQPGDYDAILTAKPDEPLFPVQGGDPRGPSTVQFWADFARAGARACLQGAKVRVLDSRFELYGGPEVYDPTEADQLAAERLLKKATNAEQVAWAMQAYQRGEDDQEGERASYSDVLTDQMTGEALDRASRRKALISMKGQLHNAVAIAQAVVDALATMRAEPMAEVKIREALAGLREAAEEIDPRLGREKS